MVYLSSQTTQKCKAAQSVAKLFPLFFYHFVLRKLLPLPTYSIPLSMPKVLMKMHYWSQAKVRMQTNVQARGHYFREVSNRPVQGLGFRVQGLGSLPHTSASVLAESEATELRHQSNISFLMHQRDNFLKAKDFIVPWQHILKCTVLKTVEELYIRSYDSFNSVLVNDQEFK